MISQLTLLLYPSPRLLVTERLIRKNRKQEKLHRPDKINLTCKRDIQADVLYERTKEREMVINIK